MNVNFFLKKCLILTIASFTKRKYKCMGVQPSGTPYMIT